MKYTTGIDTLALQIDCNDGMTQHVILDGLLMQQNNFPSTHLAYQDYTFGTNTNLKKRKHIFFCKSTKLATIDTGSYRYYNYQNYSFETKFYINIKFAGLRSYNELADKTAYDFLLLICSYLNTRGIFYKLTELDICIDSFCKMENILAICTRKAPKTQYYPLNSVQRYDTTTYIEKIAKNKLKSAVLRAYTYDKGYKEELDQDITRFEIKLGSTYFRRYGCSAESIVNALNRYSVLYFEDVNLKNAKMEAYSNYQVVRKREIQRLEFEKYRLYADAKWIMDYINHLYSVNFNNQPYHYREIL
jgi:hypothetical protein